jgi:predicted esterase
MHLQELNTKAWYRLYLPESYDQAGSSATGTRRKHPLVMTLHGMKPFDNAHSQCREWQQEADRYGFVVCAPELLTPDVFSPLPLNRVTSSLRRDESAILAIMDEVMRTVDVDPNAVLVTSWSYGGYLAHYMLNQHPERFTCLAVKQSNFSSDILEPRNVPRYRDYKVAVFYTENDFAICQRESQEAAVWYSRHGLDLTFAEFSGKGHERTPSLAAAHFARVAGATAKTPPLELAALQVKEHPVLDRTDAKLAGVGPPPTPTEPGRAAAVQPPTLAAKTTTGDTRRAGEPRDVQVAAVDTGAGSGIPVPATAQRRFTQWRPIESTSPLRTRAVTPERRAPVRPRPRPRPPSQASQRTESPVRIRLSSTIGIAPLMVSYSAALRDDISRKAYYLWMDNGEPISNGVNGQTFLTKPGEHQIEVLVTTEDGLEYRSSRMVTVLERIISKRQSD